MAVNKKDLAGQIANEFNITKKLAEAIIDDLVSLIEGTVKGGEEVAISGLGKWKLKEKAARKARNPKTGAILTVPAKTVVSYKMASSLKKVE